MSGKNIFASKINLFLVTRDSSKSKNVLSFYKKKRFDSLLFFALFRGLCTKKRKSKPNEELEGSKFGKCNKFLW